MSRSKIDLKVVLLGAHAAGKTCLCNRFLYSTYNENQTVGAAFGSKSVTINDRDYILGLWDTAGHERYQSMAKMYYRDAGAAVVCFDLTNQASFEKVRFWVGELQENEPTCKVHIVGTKVDLIDDGMSSRAVDRTTVDEYVARIGARYYEASAKTGKGVNEIFQAVTALHVQQLKKQISSYKTDAVDVSRASPSTSTSSGGFKVQQQQRSPPRKNDGCCGS